MLHSIVSFRISKSSRHGLQSLFAWWSGLPCPRSCSPGQRFPTSFLSQSIEKHSFLAWCLAACPCSFSQHLYSHNLRPAMQICGHCMCASLRLPTHKPPFFDSFSMLFHLTALVFPPHPCMHLFCRTSTRLASPWPSQVHDCRVRLSEGRRRCGVLQWRVLLQLGWMRSRLQLYGTHSSKSCRGEDR